MHHASRAGNTVWQSLVGVAQAWGGSSVWMQALLEGMWGLSRWRHQLAVTGVYCWRSLACACHKPRSSALRAAVVIC